jgi:cell division protein FtsW
VTGRTTTVGGDARKVQHGIQEARRDHPTARRMRPPRRPAPMHFYVLAVVITVLTMLGLVMVLSASSVMALHSGSSGWTYFQKQLLWAVLGAGALFLGMRVPYQAWRRFVTPALIVSFALMLATFVPGIGREVNGARAWIALGPFGFEPSELLKLALLLYTADLLTRRADRMHDLRQTLWPPLTILVLGMLLMVGQSDLGASVVLAAIVLTVLFIAGAPLFPLAGVTAAASGMAVVFIMSKPYRRERWTAFLDLAEHRQDQGFQVWQSLVGIASGGLSGAGLGAGKAKWGFLPEAHTDFIFAIIAEELGFLGAFIVCALFLLLGVLGARVALRCDDRFGMLLAGGIVAWLLVQAVINIGGVTGIMPLTGLTLPFVSFGGSSLLVTMAAAGVLLNIARTTS